MTSSQLKAPLGGLFSAPSLGTAPVPGIWDLGKVCSPPIIPYIIMRVCDEFNEIRLGKRGTHRNPHHHSHGEVLCPTDVPQWRAVESPKKVRTQDYLPRSLLEGSKGGGSGGLCKTTYSANSE